MKAHSLALLAALIVGAPAEALATEAAGESSLFSSTWALHTSASAALDNPAFAAAVGGRYRRGRWLFGADVELNPWASLPAKTLRPGALNVYATAIHLWDMRAESVKLRTTGHLGTSVLLFDLYGAPAGSVGLYLGLSLLGLEIETAPGLYLILDPADVAIPAPQLRGAPLTYRQYRATVGLQWGG